MLDLLPLHESMKRSLRVRRFRHGNMEHSRHWSPRNRPHYPSTYSKEIRAA